MAFGAQLVCVAMVAWAVTPVVAFARAPKSATPMPASELLAPESSDEARAAPDVDPATVGAAEAAASEGDEAHLSDAAAQAVPSAAERVLSNRQVQTMVGLFGRGVLVNDDAEEPPTTPVSLRVRTKRAGAAVSFTFAF